jgi:hypothetical protein
MDDSGKARLPLLFSSDDPFVYPTLPYHLRPQFGLVPAVTLGIDQDLYCFVSISLPFFVANCSFFLSLSGPEIQTIMCYQVVERYAVCRCLYHRHAIDPCQSYGQRNHYAQEKTVLVGYACPRHAIRRTEEHVSYQDRAPFPDSGYSSGGSAFRSASDYHR